MRNKQAQRSETTKKQILQAAGRLFSQKGYDAVSIREIAKAAKCSHTTIYLYFTDKETLLYQLSEPALLDLQQRLQEIAASALRAEDIVKTMSRTYIEFCLQHRNIYTILMNAKSDRVDEKEPDLAINQLRNHIFDILMSNVQACLVEADEETVRAYTRVVFYTINGILHTYSYLHEPVAVLMERLRATFDLTMEVLLSGIKQKQGIGGNTNED